MRGKLVAGNWKMHGNLTQNAALLTALRQGATSLLSVRMVVCVPFPYLAQAQLVLAGTKVQWGGQNLSQHSEGAFTGEVSGAMLRDFGSTHVIVGHSEHRALCGEDDEKVALKFGAALAAGLIPILCVGETLAERDAGVTQQVVDRQMTAVVNRYGVEGLVRGVLAYEPVWAIGTGRTASPEQAQAVHAFLRSRVAERDERAAAALPVVYGGSVKASNAGELFVMPDIDGGLVGGASLSSEEFLAIYRAAEHAIGGGR